MRTHHNVVAIPLSTTPNTRLGDVLKDSLLNKAPFEIQAAIAVDSFHVDEHAPQVGTEYKSLREEYVHDAFRVPFRTITPDAANIRVTLRELGGLLTGFTFGDVATLRLSVVLPGSHKHFEDYYDFERSVAQELGMIAKVAGQVASEHSDIEGGDGSLLSKFNNVPEVQKAVLNMLSFLFTVTAREYHAALALYSFELNRALNESKTSKNMYSCITSVMSHPESVINPKELPTVIKRELNDAVSVFKFKETMRKMYGSMFTMLKSTEASFGEGLMHEICNLDPSVFQHQLTITLKPSPLSYSMGADSPTCFFPRRWVAIPIYFNVDCLVVGEPSAAVNDDTSVLGISPAVTLSTVINGRSAHSATLLQLKEEEATLHYQLFTEISRFVPVNLLVGRVSMFGLVPNPDPDFEEDDEDGTDQGSASDLELAVSTCDSAMKHKSNIDSVLDLVDRIVYMADTQLGVGDVVFHSDSIRFSYPSTVILCTNPIDFTGAVANTAHASGSLKNAFFSTGLFEENGAERYTPVEINGTTMALGAYDLKGHDKEVKFIARPMKYGPVVYGTKDEVFTNEYYYDRPGNSKAGIKPIDDRRTVGYFCALMYKMLATEYGVSSEDSLHTKLTTAICDGEVEVCMGTVITSIEKSFSHACAAMMHTHEFSFTVNSANLGGSMYYLSNEALFNM